MSENVEYRDLAALGFPGYRVGDDGSVWSCKNARWGLRDTWKQMKTALAANGYRVVTFNGVCQRYVHEMVLLAFVGPRPEPDDTTKKYECRHLDGDPLNCHLYNLCWGTQAEQWEDKIRHGRPVSHPGLKGEASSSAKLTEVSVRSVYHRILALESTTSIAGSLGVSKPTISAIKTGRTWKHLFSDDELRRMKLARCRRRRA